MRTWLLFCIVSILLVSSSQALVCERTIIESRDIKGQFTQSNRKYILKTKIDLEGETLAMPKGCTIVFKGGSFCNGRIIFNDTRLKGSPKLSCRVEGTIRNECIEVGWFDKSVDHILSDVFSVSENKKIVFPKSDSYNIDHMLYIPTCVIEGNGSVINLLDTDESHSANKVFKIVNRNFGSTSAKDCISIYNLNFETSCSKDVYLFALRSTENCILDGCSFVCKASPTQSNTMHCLDLSGNNYNTTIKKCIVNNKADVNEGGCFWARTISGVISGVHVVDCQFSNNSLDETLAFNPVAGDLSDIDISNCTFEYHIGENSSDNGTQIAYGLNNKEGYFVNNVVMKQCTLNTDFLSPHIIRADEKQTKNILVRECAFNINDAKRNKLGLQTSLFAGKNMTLNGCNIVISNLESKKTSNGLFNITSCNMISNRVSINEASCVFSSCYDVTHKGNEISIQTGYLYTGTLPKVSANNIINLKTADNTLIINLYDQSNVSIFEDNIIHSALPYRIIYGNVKNVIIMHNNHIEKANEFNTQSVKK